MSRYTITDVVELLQIPRTGKGNDNEYGIVCPVCGDAKGKCTVRLMKDGKEANLFHCWNPGCNAGGGMMDLFLAATNMFSGKNKYKEANAEINRLLGLGNHIETKPKRKTIVHVSNRAPDDVIDQTYRTMLSFLPLRKVDMKNLMERGLDEDDIKAGLFASVPRDSSGICSRLIKAGCKLEGVPGFYMKNGIWYLNAGTWNAGYFCPVFQNGMVIGMQVRVRNPKKQKYVWLSSSNKEKGCSSKSPCTHFPGQDARYAGEVFLVEGILKSYVTYCLMGRKKSVIGFAGVGCASNVRKIFDGGAVYRKAVTAIDMDQYLNPFCDRDYDEEKCSACLAAGGKEMLHTKVCPTVCTLKNNKRMGIQHARDELWKICKSYGMKTAECSWDCSMYKGRKIWNGNIKGIDDYLLEERKKKTWTR